jgi:hypothetical protein
MGQLKKCESVRLCLFKVQGSRFKVQQKTIALNRKRSEESPIDSIGMHGTHPADSGMAESTQQNQLGGLADSTLRNF